MKEFLLLQGVILMLAVFVPNVKIMKQENYAPHMLIYFIVCIIGAILWVLNTLPNWWWWSLLGFFVIVAKHYSQKI